jgi:hypothetical protein
MVIMLCQGDATRSSSRDVLAGEARNGRMTLVLGILICVVGLVLLRIVVMRLLVKFRRDLAALNAGDHQSLLSEYAKDTVLVCRTRWGKIIHQENFYVDTVRMLAFDRKLTELGM